MELTMKNKIKFLILTLVLGLSGCNRTAAPDVGRNAEPVPAVRPE
jgi:starvation-inducible outer membrane lipoprotein